jgi:mono/diheme cytochrome c family protein
MFIWLRAARCSYWFVAWLGCCLVANAVTREVPNFNLVDLREHNHQLRRVDAKAVVLFFTGNGCPVARQSVKKLKDLNDRFGKEVAFWIINTYAEDSRKDCRKEYADFEMQPLTYLRDPKQGVALALGVERTAEVVVIKTADWSVIYQGQIDDQLTEGAQKPKAEQTPLADALSAFIAGQPITAPHSTAHGCRISYTKTGAADGPVSYSQTVAPLLKQHCAECHREDGIAPWNMDGYGHVKNYARMIEEVILTGQMPPWHADSEHGRWANDRSLNIEQTQNLLRWVAAGAPRGDGPDPLAEPLPPAPEWSLGKPDFVIALPKPEEVPANGVLDYRHIRVALPVTNDLWLAALEVKPGNRRVVHHVIVRAKWPGGPDDGSGNGIMLTGWAPGLVNARFANGTGKHVPPGSEIDLEMH